MNWHQIREYPDGSTVYAREGSDWLAFCEPTVGPNDANAVTGASTVAQAWLKRADQAQTAIFE
jgi:hypothetical protein